MLSYSKTEELRNYIMFLDEKIGEASSMRQKQATATQELSGTMEELAKSANNLKRASNVGDIKKDTQWI